MGQRTDAAHFIMRSVSAEVAARIAAARTPQTKRYAVLPEDRRIRTNAEADGALLDEIATPDAEGKKLLLDAAPTVRRIHVAEALGYRRIALSGPCLHWHSVSFDSRLSGAAQDEESGRWRKESPSS